QRVRTIVWCAAATVDRRNRPRSRVLHPIWEGTTGWIATGRHSFKEKHLAANPHLSLAYVADMTKPLYVDCAAAWDDQPATKQRIWELYRSTPPPLGYDPKMIWPSADDPSFGLLRLTPWRIEVANFPGTSLVW